MSKQWLEEWKIGRFPKLPGLYFLADSERLEKICFIGAAAKSIADEASQASCEFGSVLKVVGKFYPNYIQGYWPCPLDIALIGQLPNLAEKLIEEHQPLINERAIEKNQIKATQTNSYQEVEILQ